MAFLSNEPSPPNESRNAKLVEDDQGFYLEVIEELSPGQQLLWFYGFKYNREGWGYPAANVEYLMSRWGNSEKHKMFIIHLKNKKADCCKRAANAASAQKQLVACNCVDEAEHFAQMHADSLQQADNLEKQLIAAREYFASKAI